MHTKTDFNKVVDMIEKYSCDVEATDERFYRNAVIMHCDGTFLSFNYAFMVEVDCDWIAIITEHHGNFVYDKEDLLWYRQFSGSVEIECLSD